MNKVIHNLIRATTHIIYIRHSTTSISESVPVQYVALAQHQHYYNRNTTITPTPAERQHACTNAYTNTVLTPAPWTPTPVQ